MVMVGSVCSDGGVCMRTSFDVWLLYLCTYIIMMLHFRLMNVSFGTSGCCLTSLRIIML